MGFPSSCFNGNGGLCYIKRRVTAVADKISDPVSSLRYYIVGHCRLCPMNHNLSPFLRRTSRKAATVCRRVGACMCALGLRTAQYLRLYYPTSKNVCLHGYFCDGHQGKRRRCAVALAHACAPWDCAPRNPYACITRQAKMCACTDIFAMDIKESGDGVPSLRRIAYAPWDCAPRNTYACIIHHFHEIYNIFLEFTANRTFSGENFP